MESFNYQIILIYIYELISCLGVARALKVTLNKFQVCMILYIRKIFQVSPDSRAGLPSTTFSAFLTNLFPNELGTWIPFCLRHRIPFVLYTCWVQSKTKFNEPNPVVIRHIKSESRVRFRRKKVDLKSVKQRKLS